MTSTSSPTIASGDRWPALESSSEAFTALLHRLLLPTLTSSPPSSPNPTPTPAPPPCPSYSFQDVFSLEDEYLALVQGEVLALILAYDNDAIAPSASSVEDEATAEGGRQAQHEGVVFIPQLPVLDNACGILALIHAAANALPASAVPPSSLLGSFLQEEEESSSTPEQRARRLDAHDALRTAHWYVQDHKYKTHL